MRDWLPGILRALQQVGRPHRRSSLSLFRKLVAGDQLRKTRLHDEKGIRIPLPYLWRHGPRAVASFVLFRLLGYRPTLPYIPYAATEALEQVLTSTSIVLEFGSGMSTVWLAQRCGRVYSVEDSREWFEIVSSRLRSERRDNVTYVLAAERNQYTGFPETLGVCFDVIIVDGSFREDCLRRALPYLKPAGYVYLDDVDKDMTVSNGDLRRSESLLLDVVAQHDGTLSYFTDFGPIHLTAKQGVLARIPGAEPWARGIRAPSSS